MTKNALNIVQRYYPAIGGAELFMKLLSEYQSKNLKFNVDVWTTDVVDANSLWDLDGEEIQKKKEVINGVSVRRFSIGKSVLGYKYPNKIFRLLFQDFPNFKLANLATCPTVFEMLEEVSNRYLKQYDVVTVSSTPYYFLFYVGYLVARKQNIPLVIAPAFHVGTSSDDKLRKKYFRKTAIKFFEYASKIILNTSSEGDEIIKFAKENGIVIDPSKFVVVGQGVFPAQIKGGDGRRFREKYGIENAIVFQVGSKNIEKGSYNLIEAMKKVWKSGSDSTLVFAGSYNEEFSEYIENLEERYKKKILNIDNISEEDKLDLYDAGDVFSMISKTDSFGIVYLEAWFYKKPVLGCKNKVMEEVINDKKDGFLLEFDDIDSIAKKISLLLEDKKIREQMGRLGHEKVLSKYNWDENIKKLDQIYDM